MIEPIQRQGVTVIELGSSYDSLDDAGLAEMGGTLLTVAATAEPPQVVVDLSQTNFIASRFIELLVRAWKRLTERGGTLVLCGLQPFCAEVIRVTRLDTLWESFATQEEAVAALAQRS